MGSVGRKSMGDTLRIANEMEYNGQSYLSLKGSLSGIVGETPSSLTSGIMAVNLKSIRTLNTKAPKAY